MPPKKEEVSDSAIAGLTARETKMAAAAFVASTGVDKVCLFNLFYFQNH